MKWNLYEIPVSMIHSPRPFVCHVSWFAHTRSQTHVGTHTPRQPPCWGRIYPLRSSVPGWNQETDEAWRDCTKGTYLSLPKKGSSCPFEFRTKNHGQPNAPRSSASFVLSLSCCLYGALFAP